MNVLCVEKCSVSDSPGIFHFSLFCFIICVPSALQMNIKKKKNPAWVWLNFYSKDVTTRRNKIDRIKNPLLTCKKSQRRCLLTGFLGLLPFAAEQMVEEAALEFSGGWNEQLATATALEFGSPFKVRKYIEDWGRSSIYMADTAMGMAFSSSWNYRQY